MDTGPLGLKQSYIYWYIEWAGIVTVRISATSNDFSQSKIKLNTNSLQRNM